MWTARDGAPQVITELAQDPDGTLWIGSESGLFNFDGQTFRPFQSPPGEPELPSGEVYSLLITKAGTLWAGFYPAGVARISAGRVTVFSHAETESLVTVQQLREAPDGSIWAIDGQWRLIRFGTDGTWRARTHAVISPRRRHFCRFSEHAVARSRRVSSQASTRPSLVYPNRGARRCGHRLRGDAGRRHLDERLRRHHLSGPDAADQPARATGFACCIAAPS